VLLATVPLVPWLGLAPTVRDLGPATRTALALGAGVALSAAAVGIAMGAMPAPDPYGDPYK
jgi:hypothetical protein